MKRASGFIRRWVRLGHRAHVLSIKTERSGKGGRSRAQRPRSDGRRGACSLQGPRRLPAAALALCLVLALLGDAGGAPQRLFERRNWTPQAMLYLKGAQGRRFLSDQSRRKSLSERPSPERRSSNSQPLTLPAAAALLLASWQTPSEDGEENFEQTRFLEDNLLNW
ncbi:spexin [Dasypus novemcinctus]|uniref:spexin n=1 Tax=Dasypus novemcinctus TaxID=9361 RepID=UPI00265E32E8|nr:spexin [Dasypus novemcinctus]